MNSDIDGRLTTAGIRAVVVVVRVVMVCSHEGFTLKFTL